MNKKNQLVDVEKIRELAASKGLSISALAKKIGLRRQGLNPRLHGQYVMLADEIYLIADALDVSADELRK